MSEDIRKALDAAVQEAAGNCPGHHSADKLRIDIAERAQTQQELKRMQTAVVEFQKDIIGDSAPYFPTRLDASEKQWRYDRMLEELDEWMRADDVYEEHHELTDLLYVVLGTMGYQGFNASVGFDAVHRANMAKKPGTGTKRAIKPEGWIPANFHEVFAEDALRAQVSPAFVHATKIRIEKGAAYNQSAVNQPRDEYFPLENMSYFQMVWVKAVRLKSFVTGAGSKTENFLAELVDLLNYGAFWWEKLTGKKGQG